MDTTVFNFLIPSRLWLSSNQRLHRMDKARRVQALRHIASLKAKSHPKISSYPVTIIATIGYKTKGRADPPNAWPTVKALIDGLVDAKVLADDDSTHVAQTIFERDNNPTTSPTSPYKVTLVITARKEDKC